MISFGPVPSRRLGKSLGINNITSPKVCSYCCIYCQIGKTVKQTSVRQSFFQPEEIYKKVAQHLKEIRQANYPDYLTFVSNGEPTLDINLGRAIKLLKKIGLPIAVISNASLLNNESVREDLHLADWVSLKMDAGDNNTWHLINNPIAGYDFEKTLKSATLFAAEFKGILRTETMMVADVNDSTEHLLNLAELIKNINPGKAYLAIPTRPPVENMAKPPNINKLNLAWQIFNNKHIRTEFLTGFEGTETGFTGNIYEDILNITAVHPLREDSLIELLHNDNADFQVVNSLVRQRLIRSTIYEGNKYYLRDYHLNI